MEFALRVIINLNKMKLKEYKTPKRKETIYLCLGVRDAYLGFDQEDYCYKGLERCDNCFGCIQYKNLQRAYKIIGKYLPKIKENYKKSKKI